MPGASHKIAANYLYSVAKPDGLTLIGSILPGLYLDQLIGQKEVKYDWAKFVWIGSPVKGDSQMTMRADAPYKSGMISAMPKSLPDAAAQVRPAQPIF
jgi:tripartite-type tricarboxylate transporter receptor subunit TctC